MAELLRWNAKINLISRQDEKNVWEKHVLGSLSVLFNFRFPTNSRVFDLGTGGGLPGIPLAILEPSIHFTLVDSIRKKITAVDQMVKTLGLANVHTVWIRAEDLVRTNHEKELYDYVVARAVSSMNDVVTWTKGLLKHGPPEMFASNTVGDLRPMLNPGAIVLIKGGDLRDELHEVTTKCKPRAVQSIPLIVEGVPASNFVDKKIVIIKP